MNYTLQEKPSFNSQEKFCKTNAFPGDAPVSPSSGNAVIADLNSPTLEPDDFRIERAGEEEVISRRDPDRAPVSPLSGIGRAEQQSAGTTDDLVFASIAHAENFCKQYRSIQNKLKPLYHEEQH